jgi:hypothetical protein
LSEYNRVVSKLLDGSFEPGRDYAAFIPTALAQLTKSGSSRFASTISKVFTKYPEPVEDFVAYRMLFDRLVSAVSVNAKLLCLVLGPIVEFSLMCGRYEEAAKYIFQYERAQEKPDQDMERRMRQCQIELSERRRIEDCSDGEMASSTSSAEEDETLKALHSLNEEVAEMTALLRASIRFEPEDFECGDRSRPEGPTL